MPPFSRIVRFENGAGKVFFGEVPGSDLVTQDTLIQSTVAVYTDHTPFEEDFTLTEKKEKIAKVCAESPLEWLSAASWEV